jgi:hypothetical protein
MPSPMPDRSPALGKFGSSWGMHARPLGFSGGSQSKGGSTDLAAVRQAAMEAAASQKVGAEITGQSDAMLRLCFFCTLTSRAALQLLDAPSVGWLQPLVRLVLVYRLLPLRAAPPPCSGLPAHLCLAEPYSGHRWHCCRG